MRLSRILPCSIVVFLISRCRSYPVEESSDFDPSRKPDDQISETEVKEEIQKNLIDLLMKWYRNTENQPSLHHYHHLRHHHNLNALPGGKDPVEEEMQNDQPMEEMQADAPEGSISSIGVGLLSQINNNENYIADIDTSKLRDRKRDVETYGRDKNERINSIKHRVQQHTGRVNGTKTPGTAELLKLLLNSSKIPVENILGHAASSYPSCEIPKNTDIDAWRDENIINLYFPDDPARETNASIATAILKLYRIFSENNSTKHSSNEVACDSSLPEEEKLLRVSVFWYTKSLKKHRVKRRLCDSKVISEKNKWIELNIMHAIKAWSKGKNLGLAITVEDQEQNILKASKYFKGITCTVGDTSSTDVSDTVPRYFGRIGRDHPTAPIHGGISLLPMISYCLLNSSHNHSVASQTTEFSITACKIQKNNYADSTRELQQKLQLVFQNANKTRQNFNPFDPRNGIRDKQLILSYPELIDKIKQINNERLGQ